MKTHLLSAQTQTSNQPRIRLVVGVPGRFGDGVRARVRLALASGTGDVDRPEGSAILRVDGLEACGTSIANVGLLSN